MELYLELDAVITASTEHTFTLLKSKTGIGYGSADNFELGVVAVLNLIVKLEGGVDMSCGFQIKVDGGTTLDIALFGENVSRMVL
jgi:hypothetical protein